MMMIKKRTYSILIDLFVYVALTLLVAGLYRNNATWTKFIFLILSTTCMFIALDTVISYLTKGQSLGKMIIGIKITGIDSQKVSFKQLIKRNGPLIWFELLCLLILTLATIIDFRTYNFFFSGSTIYIHENLANPKLLNLVLISAWIAPIVWIILEVLSLLKNAGNQAFQDKQSLTIVVEK
jgi:uncharacterized RDD family membrane protein YckC